MGLFIGSLVSGSAAPGYANLFYLPGVYLSGLFFPLPKSMHCADADLAAVPSRTSSRCTAGGADKFKIFPPQMYAAILIGITVLFGGLAIWRLARKG